MQRKYDFIFKFVIVGSSSVGKSSILKRFADDEFEDSYISTIGIDFRFKYLCEDCRSLMIDDAYVKLQIWDTAGQERFRGITKSYYKGAEAVILVYDWTNEKTFEDIKTYWLKESRTNAEGGKIYVFANKCDDPDTKIPEEHAAFLRENKVEVCMVSAKTGRGVSDGILKIAKHMMQIHPRVEEESLAMGLKAANRTPQTGRCCSK